MMIVCSIELHDIEVRKNYSDSYNKDRIEEKATMSLVISEETLKTIQLTEEELRAEIAVMLFQQERLTLAQASHFANQNIVQFQRLLASRKIPLHYDIDDLREDVQSLQENNWR